MNHEHQHDHSSHQHDHSSHQHDHSSHQHGHSVHPGINDPFLNQEHTPESFLEKFEVEAREIFAKKKELVDQFGDLKGKNVADIGAGTGLFMDILSERIGTDGKLFSLEVASKFIPYLEERKKKLGIQDKNIEIKLIPQTDITVENIDVAILIDAYHHVEFPTPFLASVKRALRKDGKFIVVDFERIPGKSNDWIMNHVRANKEIAWKEITEGGFKLVETKEGVLTENWIAIFTPN